MESKALIGCRAVLNHSLVMLCKTIYWTILINKFTAEFILSVHMCYFKHLVKGGNKLFPNVVCCIKEEVYHLEIGKVSKVSFYFNVKCMAMDDKIRIM